MKVSDYVAEFLRGLGIKHVFAITGGASVHLIDSIARTDGIEYICPQHEQAGAMAADATARVSGRIASAISTSGPGATNMITGVCTSYYDSIPVLYITGQVASFRLKGNMGIRQLGFQETDIVDMLAPVTKYAVQILDPKQIRYELEKAAHYAISGRPGPVLVDIPDDIGRSEIEPAHLPSFSPKTGTSSHMDHSAVASEVVDLLRQAQRPVMIMGWGIRAAHAEAAAIQLAETCGLPILPTWAMADVVPADHPLLIGTFGTHGTRHANFAVQNADFVLSIGARLDTREAGSPIDTFAREAKRIVVDIDRSELDKFATLGLEVTTVQADAADFVSALQSAAGTKWQEESNWLQRIDAWRTKYPVCDPAYELDEDVNPYVLVRALSDGLSEDDTIFIDTGCALAWMMQAFRFKPGQRAFSSFNNTPMGYGLPGAIGASIALDGAPVICITGDGGFQMNIQELATVVRHNLPIKIFLFNNRGYSMIQQTQDQWLDSRYEASNVGGGLASPNFSRLAEAYGLATTSISTRLEIISGIEQTLRNPGPVLCNIEIRPEHRVIPQVSFGRPIEDSEPLLDRVEFYDNMIISPHESSMPLVEVPN
jgi:acetolactate synthase I/II/III large subunit